MPEILPILRTDDDSAASPLQEYAITLDGVGVIVRWTWHARLSVWTLSLALEDGTILHRNVGVRKGWPLTLTISDTRKPPGELFVLGPADGAPTLASLGAEDQAVYFTQAEMATLRARYQADETLRLHDPLLIGGVTL